MNMKILVTAFAIILAVGAVAVRVVLDTPRAFAQTQSVNDMKHGVQPIGAMYMLGDLVIENVTARATVPGAKVGGGYLSITNNGTAPDTLITGETDVAGELQIHEMKMQGDVMKMRRLDQGIVIKPGATVTLMPGGFHIMFMALEAPLEKDTSFKATLNFANAGVLEVEFNVMDGKHFMSNHNH